MAPSSRRLPVVFTPAAIEDVDVAFAYVNERNQAAARDLAARLRGTLDRLGTFPALGAALPSDQFEFASPGVRFVVVEPYLVFYRLTEDRVVVLRVLHTKQDALGQLFE